MANNIDRRHDIKGQPAPRGGALSEERIGR